MNIVYAIGKKTHQREILFAAYSCKIRAGFCIRLLIANCCLRYIICKIIIHFDIIYPHVSFKTNYLHLKCQFYSIRMK